MLLLRQFFHQETGLLSLWLGRRAKSIDLTTRNGYYGMRTITDDRLRLVLQPHAVCLSGFRNLRAPLTRMCRKEHDKLTRELLMSAWALLSELNQIL